MYVLIIGHKHTIFLDEQMPVQTTNIPHLRSLKNVQSLEMVPNLRLGPCLLIVSNQRALFPGISIRK